MMNFSHRRLLRAATAGVAALCLGSLLLARAATAQAGAIARIQTLVGLVEVLRQNSRLSVNRGNFPLQAADRVRTGADGRARIVTEDGKRATMGPNAEIELQVHAARVNGGRVSFWITGRGRTEIGTPGATAAAEGTGFQVEVEANGVSTLTVAEGTVEFYNEQGRVTVRPDEQSTARPGQAPTPPIAANGAAVLVFEGTVENLPLSLETPRLNLAADRLRALLPERQAAAQAAPDDAPAQLALGDVRYDLGDLEAARAAYLRAGELQPNGAVPLARLVQVEIGRGRPDLAEAALARLQAAAPDSGEAALAAGRLQLARGKADDARAPLERAMTQLPQSGEAPVLLGRALFRLGDLKGAETALRTAIERQPDNFAAHAYLSGARLALGDTSGAGQAARRAVELAPQSSLSHEALGAALLFSGRAEDAVKELQQAVEINPASAPARVQLARALAGADRLPEAVRQGSQAVALDPGEPAAHVTLGTLFLADNDPHRAEREFRHGLRLAPQMASGKTGLASVALEQGAFSRALREQKAGIALDPGSAQARNNLGAVYLAQGRLNDAVREFGEAVRLQPGLAVAHSNLALAYLEQNRYAQALDSARRAARLGERSAILHTTLARIYMRQNRLERALVELRIAENLDPFYPLQRFYLSQVYRLQGRDRDALRTLFRGVILDPSAMAEQRLYSRLEGTAFGGENHTAEGDLKLDGRAADGRLSYFASGSVLSQQVRPERGDVRRGFGEGILGLESGSRNNLVLYGSLFDERVERPGQDFPGGRIEDPNFRTGFNGTDGQLLDRFRFTDRDWLTLKTGFRRGFLEAHNPANPPGTPDPFPLTYFAGQDRNFLAEGLWERRAGRRNRDLLQAGVSYLSRERSFVGNVPAVPSPGVLNLLNRESPSFYTVWGEFFRQVNPRLDFRVGPYAGIGSHTGTILRPKAVVHYNAGGGNRLAALVYPQFQSQNADLLPVESWAQPFDLDRILQADDSVVTNYELSWERTLPAGDLFSATGFYRRGRSFLIPTVDPLTAPVVTRLPFESGEIFGGQVAAERPLSGSLTGRIFARFQETNNLQGPGDLPYFPRWLTGARLDYLDRHGIRTYLAVNYVGSRVHRDFVTGPEFRLGSYVTADFRISWQENLHRSWFIQVSDLFDRGADFYRHYHTAGRTLVGGLEFRF
jgi:tetratricopeptide (TPR) repeat protein